MYPRTPQPSTLTLTLQVRSALTRSALGRCPQTTVRKGAKGKEVVAKCAEWYGVRPGSKKVGVAAGVEGLIVLALLSEWDANWKGKETDPHMGCCAA